MNQLSTGNLWIDVVIAAVIPVAMRILTPNKSISGSLALDMLFLGCIPIFRSKWTAFRDHAKAKGIDLMFWLRNSYQTTIEFEKEVRKLVRGDTIPWMVLGDTLCHILPFYARIIYYEYLYSSNEINSRVSGT